MMFFNKYQLICLYLGGDGGYQYYTFVCVYGGHSLSIYLFMTTLVNEHVEWLLPVGHLGQQGTNRIVYVCVLSP
jgi:hypothetical protein